MIRAEKRAFAVVSVRQIADWDGMGPSQGALCHPCHPCHPISLCRGKGYLLRGLWGNKGKRGGKGGKGGTGGTGWADATTTVNLQKYCSSWRLQCVNVQEAASCG